MVAWREEEEKEEKNDRDVIDRWPLFFFLVFFSFFLSSFNLDSLPPLLLPRFRQTFKELM